MIRPGFEESELGGQPVRACDIVAIQKRDIAPAGRGDAAVARLGDAAVGSGLQYANPRVAERGHAGQ